MSSSVGASLLLSAHRAEEISPVLFFGKYHQLPTGLQLSDLCYIFYFQIYCNQFVLWVQHHQSVQTNYEKQFQDKFLCTTAANPQLSLCLVFLRQFVPGAEFVRKMLCCQQTGTQSAKSAAITACSRQKVPLHESKIKTFSNCCWYIGTPQELRDYHADRSKVSIGSGIDRTWVFHLIIQSHSRSWKCSRMHRPKLTKL